jgi:hypothetical protein
LGGACDFCNVTPVPPASKITLKPGRHVVTYVVGAQRFPFEVNIRSGEDTRLIKTLEVTP